MNKAAWVSCLVAGLPLASLQATAGEPLADARFGVMTHFAHGWDPDWVPLAAKAGLTQVRDELYWDSVEQEKGRFDFPESYDRYMAALEGAKIAPLVVLSFENRHYDGGKTPHTKEGFDGYARYAASVLQNYGKQIKTVEIWNEYNGSFNRGPASDNRAATYLEMLRAAYQAIKKKRPDVVVLGGATVGVPLPYWEKILSGGGLDFMDAVSVHPYRYNLPPEGIEDEIAALQRLVSQYDRGRARPVWVTEIGWSLKPSQAPGDLLIDEAVQAKFLVRSFALLQSAGVQHIYWYLLRDYENFTLGLVRDNPERTPKPAYLAMATLIHQLRNARFVRREKTLDDLYSLLFQRPEREDVRIIWSLVPRNLELGGITGVVDIGGKDVLPGASLAVDDSPVFVVGPVRGLPPPAPSQGPLLADARRDFGPSLADGWIYGAFPSEEATFTPLPTYEVTDWNAAWTGGYPYISITAVEQHPSVTDDVPVAAVRRWRSTFQGTVRITGSFRCGTEGDGVGVSLSVDGERRFRKLLGGGAAVLETFDFIETVHPGTTIDFAVDPGPAKSIDFDATAVGVAIRVEQ